MKKSLSLLLAIALVFTMAASAFAADTAATGDASATATSATYTTQEKYDQLVAAGIFEGDADGLPHLDAKMTRAQFAKILTKVFGLKENADASKVYGDLDGAGWAAGFIGAVTAAKYMEGDAGKFMPSADVTTEQLATVLVRTMGLKAVAGAKVDGTSDWAAGYVQAALDAKLIPAAADYTKAALRGALVEAGYAAYVEVTKPTPTPTVKPTPTPTQVATLDVASLVASSNTTVELKLNTAVAANATLPAITAADKDGKALEVKGAAVAAYDSALKTVVVTTAAQTANALYTLTIGDKKYNFAGIAADTGKPTVVGVPTVDFQEVKVVFNKRVDISAATYTITEKYGTKANLNVVSATLGADQKTVTFVTDNQAAVLYEFSIKGLKSVDGVAADELKPTFVGVPNSTADQSVGQAKAINSKQVEVPFGVRVDQASATNAANYTVKLKYPPNTAVVVKSVAMKTDSKDTVVLTLESDLTASLYEVTVANVTTAFGKALGSTKTSTFLGTAADTSKLNIGTASPLSNTSIRVNFNDDLTKEAAENIANYTIKEKYSSTVLNVTKATLTDSDADDTNNGTKVPYVKLNTDVQKEVLYEITVANLTDDAGNALDTKVTTFVGRKVADKISSFTARLDATDANKLIVDFNSDVDATSAKDISHYYIDGVGYPTAAAVDAGADKSIVNLTIPNTADGAILTLKVNNLLNVDLVNMDAEKSAQFVGRGTAVGLPALQYGVAVDKRTLNLYFDRDVAGATVKGRFWQADADASGAGDVINGIFETKANKSGTSYAAAFTVANSEAWQDAVNKNVLVIRMNADTFQAGADYTSIYLQINSALVKSDAKETLIATSGVDAKGPAIIAAARENNRTVTVYFDSAVSGVAAGDFVISKTATGASDVAITAATKVNDTTYKLTTTTAMENISYYLIVNDGSVDADTTISTIADASGLLPLQSTTNSTSAADYASLQFGGPNGDPAKVVDMYAVMTDNRTIEIYWPETMNANDAINLNLIKLVKEDKTALTTQPVYASYDNSTKKTTLLLQADLDSAYTGKVYAAFDDSIGNELASTTVKDDVEVAAFGAGNKGVVREFGKVTSAHAAPTISSVSVADDKQSITVTFNREVAFGTALNATQVRTTAGAAANDQFYGGAATSSSNVAGIENYLTIAPVFADGSTFSAATNITSTTRNVNNKAVTISFDRQLKLSSQGTVEVKDAATNFIIDKTNTKAAVDSTRSKATFGVDSVVAYDNGIPTVLSVTSTKDNGSYKVGAVIPVTVNFTKPVTVVGTPTLALNSGATVDYASGNGTTALTFNYTVAASENSADLDVNAANSLVLAGSSTIKSANGIAATLTLPTTSLSTAKDIVVDTLAPTATFASAVYTIGTPDTIVLTGANLTTIAASGDVKSQLDWSKFVVAIDPDGAGATGTTNVTFTAADITSATVDSVTQITITLAAAKKTAIAAINTDAAITAEDTLTITAGFAKDLAGNAATTDALPAEALN